MKLDRPFYQQPADRVAPELLGAILVRSTAGGPRRARIVETEAYLGIADLACHSARGRTARTEVMFGPAGRAYVYLIYGVHDMFNIVVGPPGSGQAVLIRAAEALDDWSANLSGPGRLARALNITRAHSGLDLLGDELFVEPREGPRPRIVRGPRIGVDYARHWTRRLLRYCIAGDPHVSRPRPPGWPKRAHKG